MNLDHIMSRNTDLKNSRKVDLLGVSKISCSGSFDVEFIQSEFEESFALALSDNEELLNNIELINSGVELHIKSKGNMTIITNTGKQVICSSSVNFSGIQIKGMIIKVDNNSQINHFNTLSGKLKIFVVLPRLNYLKLSGTGCFFSKHLQEEFLELRLSGSGDINLAGRVKRVDAKLSGTGTINLKNLVTDIAVLKLSGVGTIKSHVIESVTAKVSGVGNIKIYGNPFERNVSKSGIGKIKYK